VNKCLETYLRCLISASPKKWLQWVSLAEYWYNTGFHSAIGMSPFEALYGRVPRHFGTAAGVNKVVSGMEDWLQDRKVIAGLIQQHLNMAAVRIKPHADKGRSEHQLEVGVMVFLNLQPYIQSSLAPRANQKLSFKFFGPFPVLQKVSLVAYKLGLPASSSIHLVFHIS
jgi:hypothetical protein